MASFVLLPSIVTTRRQSPLHGLSLLLVQERVPPPGAAITLEEQVPPDDAPAQLHSNDPLVSGPPSFRIRATVLFVRGKNLKPGLSLNTPSLSTMPSRPFGNSLTSNFLAFTGAA